MARASKGPRALVVDGEAVAALAAHGLSEAELRVKLNLPVNLTERQQEALADAMREGRLRGSAELKEAQYKAALNGQVSAQGRALDLLRDEPEEDAVQVIREVYESGENDD